MKNNINDDIQKKILVKKLLWDSLETTKFSFFVTMQNLSIHLWSKKFSRRFCFFVFLSIVNGPILKKNCCQKSCVKVFVPIKNDFCVFMHCKFYCKVLQVFGPIKICSCCESFISEKFVESFNYLLEDLDITVLATKESFDQSI